MKDKTWRWKQGKAKNAFTHLENLLLQRQLRLELSMRVVRCYIWPILVQRHCCEARSLIHIRAFEIPTLTPGCFLGRKLVKQSGAERSWGRMTTLEHCEVPDGVLLGSHIRSPRYYIPKLILQDKIGWTRDSWKKTTIIASYYQRLDKCVRCCHNFSLCRK